MARELYKGLSHFYTTEIEKKKFNLKSITEMLRENIGEQLSR